MDEETVLRPNVFPELAESFHEYLALDISNRAADLSNQHVGIALRGKLVDSSLDLVGDVGDHLDRSAQVVAPAFLCDNGAINAARGYRGVPGEVYVYKPLVMPQVQVGLRAVIGDKDLAVLVGVHGAGIDIYVGVQFLHGDIESAVAKEPAKAGRSDAF